MTVIVWCWSGMTIRRKVILRQKHDFMKYFNVIWVCPFPHPKEALAKGA